MKLLILNGPNLNLIGSREPDIYGNEDFETMLNAWKKQYPQVELNYFQSNIEGEIIDQLHVCEGKYDGIIINAGAYTHTSIAIGDAVRAIKVPVIEVHLSNVMKREEFRHVSYISPAADGVISGFGMKSYELAILHFINS
jgi:3-dehydroquinate dehydratase II